MVNDEREMTEVRQSGDMVDLARKIGRPLRNGSDLDAARNAILNGCSMYQTARLTGISMYTYGRLRKELRQGGCALKPSAAVSADENGDSECPPLAGRGTSPE